MKQDNPFTLNFGRPPGKYISRHEDLYNIISTFTADNIISQTYLISGIRGSGKTVLMSTVSRELSDTGEWIVVDLNPSFDLLEELARRLYDACSHSMGLEEGNLNISIAGFGIGIGGKTREKDAVSQIEELVGFVIKKKKKILITIDEVAQSGSIRSFVTQFQIFIRREYPIYLIMTGLYENIYSIQNDDCLTFLLRAPRIFLGPLSMHQIVIQYRDIFGLDMEKAKSLAGYTKGYAFAFQALGLLYWEHRDECSFDRIIEKYDSLLDDFVYKKIWESLSEQDRAVVCAMPFNGKVKVSDIIKKTATSSSTFSKYRERLINKGVITASQHGYIELSLPRFGEITATY